MDAATRRLVRERANERCEYCRLPQSVAPFLRFHIEHIHAQQHLRDDGLSNLCLACPHCNFHKGPNLATIDAETGVLIALFHPRRHVWSEHFELRDGRIEGLSPTGRATVRLLKMNDGAQVQIRLRLIAHGQSRRKASSDSRDDSGE